MRMIARAISVIALILVPLGLTAQTYNSDGAAHDPSKQSGWAAPAVDKSAVDYNNCLRCHQQGGPVGASDKTGYLLGGHKNMSRLADGAAWGMPGVDHDHAATPALEEAGLDANGKFKELWIQEDYVRPLVNWLTPGGAARSSLTGGYCAKNAAGDVSSDDVPDLAACPHCESPVMGNGNAGYPLNYPDPETCSAAALHTGKPYTWIKIDGEPLYWIYGGAGLEGGPAMIQRGSQQYKCARCHTTGWTANSASDPAVAQQTKKPYSDFLSANLASVTTLGATSKLLGPSLGASGYPVVKANCTAGVDCDVTGVTLTAKGALYPANASVTVTLTDTTGTGCTATAVMAADAYSTSNKVDKVTVDCTASNHKYSSGAKVAISHPYSLSSWDQWGIQCSRCHTDSVDGKHGNDTFKNVKGGDIVASCLSCHRQEADTAPRSIQGGNGFTGNNGYVMPYTNKQQQPDGFAHHPDGPEFLNSPHARLTGNWKDMGCPPYAIFGYKGLDPAKPGAPASDGCVAGTMNLDGKTQSLYGSKFAQAAKVDLKGISDAVAGSCATCHDVHQPLNQNTEGMGGSIKTECTSCHSSSDAKISPQVSVAAMRHSGGLGTPFENADKDPSSACVVCHQPPGIKHLWRINTDPNYTIYGDYTYAYPVNGAAAQNTGSNAPGLVSLSHTAPEGEYKNAVWVDIDNACGQCHGGGVSPRKEVETIGSINAGGADGFINPLKVADVFGFESGKEVTVAGAGWAGADFKTIIAKVEKDPAPAISGTVYLTYPTVTTVKNAKVTVPGNEHIPEAPYMTRAQLAVAAKGIHGGSLLNAAITYTRSANKYTFGVAELACPNGPCTLTWDFGDNTKGTGESVSHDYGTAGANKSFTVILSVKDKLGASAAVTAPITVYPASAHPYENNFQQTWTYTQPGSPSSINVRFAGLTNVETGYDKIYVTDKDGKNVTGSPFTGTSLGGTTLTIAGDTVTVRLTTDYSITKWGFEIESVSAGGLKATSMGLRSRSIVRKTTRHHSGD